MKKLAFILTAIACVTCGSPNQNKKEKTPEKTLVEKEETKTINKEVPDEEDGGKMLLGKINKEAFSKETYAEWFQEIFTH